MKRIVCLLLAGVALASCNAVAAGRGNESAHPGDIIIAAQWATAQNEAASGEMDNVFASLQPAMSDEVWPQLSRRKQYDVSELYGEAADSLGLWAEAHHAFVRASDLSGSQNDWAMRLHSAISSGDAADAWVAFDHFRNAPHNILDTFGGRQLERLDTLFGALPNARDARLALGRALEQQHDALYGYNDPSIVWAHYIQALVENGDNERAKALGGRISDPIVMAAMAADPRFDGVVAANAKLKDPQAAAEEYLAWAKSQAQAQPRMLAARIAVVRALAILDRPQDALQVAQDTNRTMAHGSRSDPSFDDMHQAPVLEGWKDSLLVRLGRGDEAVAGLTSTTSCHCDAFSAVELGETLLRLGRAKEAQDWLQDAEVDRLTMDDRMELAEARVCVAVELKDIGATEENLAFLKAHVGWRGRSLVSGLLCAGRTDEAADVLRQQLANPQTRLVALRSVQVYADPDHQPFTTEQRNRWSALISRPDVRQALEKAGRVQTFRLQARGALA